MQANIYGLKITTQFRKLNLYQCYIYFLSLSLSFSLSLTNCSPGSFLTFWISVTPMKRFAIQQMIQLSSTLRAISILLFKLFGAQIGETERFARDCACKYRRKLQRLSWKYFPLRLLLRDKKTNVRPRAKYWPLWRILYFIRFFCPIFPLST